MAKSIDLRDNMRVEHLGGGYARAVPVNPAVRWDVPISRDSEDRNGSGR